ncbi:MAG: STAS/SEC14 domain-containing protein [Planctomycetes bacterium]|nr:STAS/SEC14 domain-containing protein [Planctomycetota bacterium]
MTVALREEAGGKVLVIRLGGRLLAADYEKFIPVVQRMLRQHEHIRLLIQMHDFHGWSLSKLWKDLPPDQIRFADIERLGFVGDPQWQSGSAAFCKPFSKATVRHFDENKARESLNWITEGLRDPV